MRAIFWESLICGSSVVHRYLIGCEFMFSLNLFGAVSLTRDGRPFEGPAAQKRRLALLAILAIASKGGSSRERLITLLWPDTPADQARRFLADSLYTLRKSLGADAIRAVGDNLTLADDVVCSDVTEFRRALADGQDARAVELYRGSFLEGFCVADAVEFEQWADGVRAGLAHEWAAAVERLAQAAAADRRHEVAAARWRQLQSADPLNSRIALCLMEALAASGDPAAALRHGRVHEQLLREELGIAPSEAIAAFLETVRSAPAPYRHRVVATPLQPQDEPTTGVAADPAELLRVLQPVREESQRDNRSLSGPPARARPWPRAALLLAILLVGVVAFALWHSSSPRRTRVLVNALENRTGDPALDPLGQMAADWIARGLMETSTLEVISGSAIGHEASLRSPGANGAMIAGAYYLEGPMLRLEVVVLDPRRGAVLQSVEPVTVPRDSATAGVARLRETVAVTLGARFGELRELREITGRTHPPTYAAYAAYVEGVQLFSRFQSEQAAQRLDEAWALDTTFHLAALYGVLVAGAIGRKAHADSLLRSLAPRRERMTGFDRALLDAFESERRGDGPGLLRAMRSVASKAPASQFVVGYAVTAIGANRPREALRALESLDPKTGFLRDNPRYWDWLTTARHLIGDHRRELRHARRGRAVTGTPVQEARALAALGRTDELEALLEEDAAASGGATPADLLLGSAAELQAHGYPAAAQRLLNRAFSWYQARPEAERARHRVGLARLLQQTGRLDEAGALLDTLFREQPQNPSYLGQLGVQAALRGDSARATQIDLQLAGLTDPSARRSATLWRARVAARLGESDRAVALLRDAFAAGATHGLWLHTDPDFAVLRQRRDFKALLRPRG